MGLFSPGSKWKRAAEAELRQAQNIEGVQRDVEFQRALLSNIRQQRLAQSQLALTSYNESAVSSNIKGASANIDSALAGEMTFSYGTSERMQSIQDHQQKAKEYMEKYADQQKKRSAAFAVAGVALGALTGGLGAGLAAGGMTAAQGAIMGASIGQGVGQMTSNTGQFEQGLNNTISGVGQSYRMYTLANRKPITIDDIYDY